MRARWFNPEPLNSEPWNLKSGYSQVTKEEHYYESKSSGRRR